MDYMMVRFYWSIVYTLCHMKTFIAYYSKLSLQIIPIEEFDDDSQDLSIIAESFFDSDDESTDASGTPIGLMK